MIYHLFYLNWNRVMEPKIKDSRIFLSIIQSFVYAGGNKAEVDYTCTSGFYVKHKN